MWKLNWPKLLRIYKIIEDQPGIYGGQLCKELGYRQRGYDNLLAGLERAGLLVYESDNGRLYPFRLEDLD